MGQHQPDFTIIFIELRPVTIIRGVPLAVNTRSGLSSIVSCAVRASCDLGVL